MKLMMAFLVSTAVAFAGPRIVERGPTRVIGISVRTGHDIESSPRARIPGLWKRFYAEGVPAKIQPQTHPGEVMSVYTDYSSDWKGEYTVILGCEVNSLAHVPAGMIGRTLPPARYAVFTTPTGEMPGIVVEMWKYIWGLKPGEVGGARAYLGDFDLYDKRSADPHRAQVDVWLTIK